MAIPTARQLKNAAGLDRRKNREASGHFLVEGWRSVTAAIDAGASVAHVFRSPSLVVPEAASLNQLNGLTVFDISDREMARISSVATAPGISAVVRIPESGHEKGTPNRTLFLEGVQDPGNVGTLIRTAAWLGIDCVALGRESADPFSPKVVRSTMGGIWDVRIERPENSVDWIRQALDGGVSVWVADMNGEDVGSWQVETPSVLVIGSEAHGVSDAVRRLASGAVSIPGSQGRKGVESLNAAVAGAIIMSHWASR